MLLAADPTDWQTFLQFTISGLTFGALIALIALGYTMVYGIVELINFAHGDLFMLGSFLALTILGLFGIEDSSASTTNVILALACCLIACPVFCAGLNVGVDRLVYRPLRNAPKLAPLVSAIGMSFIFMNIGLFWSPGGPQDVNFPNLMPDGNLLERLGITDAVRFTYKDLMIAAVTIPLMVGLTLFVKFTPLGKAMRATAQNPTAARLMGIDTDRVIGATFAIGGGLGGAASVVYSLYINTVSYQMGFQNGLYAFTAAVLGGIGNIPGAVLGGILIGLIRAWGSAYIGERWTSALVFAVLIVILVFRPSGVLGSRTREKV
jgi:branched-chain amino acid transport system permease protein